MAQLYAKQLAALEVLKKLDPNLTIKWDEDTGAPSLIRGLLSPASPPVGPQSMTDAAHEAAFVFLRQNKDLYRLRDPDQEFARSRVVSDEFGSTVHLYQSHQGVEVYDGALSVALDPQNRVTQVLGRYRPVLRLSSEPVVPAEKAIEIGRADLDVADKENLAPITHRLLIVNTGSFPDVVAKLGKKTRLAWRVELFVWVYFVDARDGSIIFTYDNTQTARNRETYSTTNCNILPGTLWISENGPVPGQPVDDIAWSAHRHAGAVYDYYSNNFGLDSFDGHGHELVSTVHGGVPSLLGCSQNNAAFIPSLLQIVLGDGDGQRFGPFAHALDVVAHEWQHAVTYFAITWSDGKPRGLDYRDESGALNESYSDFFGSLVENKDWLLGEDCYTPQTPDDAVRDMEDPTRCGQPDHYSNYSDSGTQGWKVHYNCGIMNKCAYLMSEGGTHYGVTVNGMGKEAAGKVWYRALTHHLQGASTFAGARPAMLQSCQELYPGDTVKYATVQNAFAAIGIGEPAPPPSIVVEPTSIDFGSVILGQSAEQTLTVRNTGTADLSVTAVQSSDPVFCVVGDTAFVLTPDASQTLTVQFSPTAVGPQQANLTIESNDTSQPTLTVPLAGTGLGVPHIAVEPTGIDCGTVTLGQSAERIVTVRNTGTADLAVTAVQSTDPAFSVIGDTNFQLAPDASQTLTVQFSPTAVGQQQANLTIESNDASQPTLTVPLSGTAVGVPRIAVEPEQIDFDLDEEMVKPFELEVHAAKPGGLVLGQVIVGESDQRPLTVRNIGTADLAVSAIHTSDPAFSVVGDTAFELAPGASKTVTVQFSPTSIGYYQGTLTLESNDSSQPTLTVPLSGTGIGVPHIVVEPTTIDFGTTTLGESAERIVTVRNTGSADLSITAVQSSDPAFSVIGDTNFELAPDASKTLTIQFSPTAVGPQQANLTIESDDSSQSTVTVALSGTAVGVSSIAVEPTTIDLGTVALGQSAEQTLTVRNTGTADLSVTAVQSSDPVFSVVGDTNFELAPDASKTLTIQFSPTAVGQQQADLTIESNDTSQPTLSVPLSGTGLGVPRIAVEPMSIDFETVALGQSAEQTLTVRNTGTADLSVTAVQSTDPAFSVVGDTNFELAPDASKTLTIQFSPTAVGQQQANLTIQSNDTSQPTLSVPLSGTGLGVPRIAVEPMSIDFETVALGQSAEQTLTVRNTGTADLSVTAVQSTDPAFSVIGDTNFELAPDASQMLPVQFSPTAVGQQQANLTIQSNDTSQPALTVPLSGTGLGVPRIAVEPTAIDFETVALGQSAEQTLTVRNTGTADLSVTAVQSSDPVFSVVGDTAFVLTPDASQTLTVQFSPTAVGPQQANLTIESDDSSQSTVTVALSGTAVGVSSIAVEPTSIDFGTVTLGQSAEHILTVRNTGTADLAVTAVQSTDPAFSAIGDTNFQLAPEASQTLTIQFSPTAVGQQQADLTIESNDSSQPTLTVPLSGTALGVPRIAVEPEQIDFDLDEEMVKPFELEVHAAKPAGLVLGQVIVGESDQRPLTVRNIGTADLVVSAIHTSDPAFSVVGDSAFELAPGASKTLTVQFSPTSVGYYEGTLTLESNDTSQPTLIVPLSGTGIGVPHIVVEPTSIDFGTVVLGQSAERTLTVRNTGSADLSVTAVQSSDPAFSVIGDTTFELPPAAARALTIQFLPTSVGQRQVNLTVQSNDSSQSTVTIGLSGTAVGVSSIAVEPTTIDFGTVTFGQSAEQTLTVRNTGSADLAVSSVQSSDPAFSVIGDTAFELAPGAAKALTVQFAPSAVGQQQATLTIESSDSSRPTVTVPLSGSAVRAPEISTEPTTLDFASVVIGDSAEMPLTISNVGGSRLLVSDMSINQPSFDVVGDPAFQLDPGTAQEVAIAFTPAVEGPVRATLSIASNDPKSPIIWVTLIGTGQPAPVEGPHIVLDPQQLNFGAIPVGQAAQRNITVKNNGTGLLTVEDVYSVLTVYNVNGETAFTVAPLASHTVTVQYKPTVEGAHGGRLIFLCNDPQQPEASIALFGTGTRCFVATASYGSPMQSELRMLRTFRDQSLTRSRAGRTLISLYYRWNNGAADWIAHSQVGRTVARWMLRPLVALARLVSRPKRESVRRVNQSQSTRRRTR